MKRALVLVAGFAVLAVGLLWILAGDGGGEAAAAVPVTARPTPSAPAPAEERAPLPTAAAEGPEKPAQRRAADEPAPDARGAFVRVLTPDGEPVADLALRVLGLGPRGEDPPTIPLLTRVNRETGADGVFDLTKLAHEPSEEIELLRLVPSERPDLELVPWSFSPEAPGATPERAFVVHARKRPATPARGVLVDEVTGEAVADFALHLRDWLEPAQEPQLDGKENESLRQGHGFPRPDAEWVVTDSEGRFETQTHLPAGRITFNTIEFRGVEGEHVIDATGVALEGRYEVEVGPRILLDFHPPGGRQHGDFVAGLWRAPFELAEDDGIVEFASPWSADAGSRAGVWGNAVAVQGGHRPWFRVTLNNVEDSPLPTRVFVMSRDGQAFGDAPIEEFERHAREPLHVELKVAHALDGVVIWPEGESRGDRANLTLTRAGAEEDSYHSQRIRRMNAEAESPFQFQYLEAGSYELELEAPNIAPWNDSYEVPMPAPLRLRLERAAVGEPHDITGRVVTRSGKPLDGKDGRAHLLRLGISSRDNHRTPPDAELTWQNGVARFHFKGVIEGQYRVYPRWNRGGFHIPSSRELRALPPPDGSPLELVVHDDVPTQVFEVRVIEPAVEGHLAVWMQYAERGRDSASFWFGYDGDPEQGITTLPDGRRAAVKDLGPRPADTEFHLQLDMEGYVSPQLGNERFAAPDERGVRVAEVVPKKGFSIEVNVYEGENEQAESSLADIVLAFDGVAASATDKDGFVYVECPSLPKTLAVLTPGWELVDRASFDDWGSVRAADGVITIESGNLTVHLKRTE